MLQSFRNFYVVSGVRGRNCADMPNRKGGELGSLGEDTESVQKEKALSMVQGARTSRLHEGTSRRHT